MKIVITGGTHCGKTALISLLSKQGYATIPDAGMLVIEELNAKLGIEQQLEYRKNKPQNFYSKILNLQNKLEKEINGEIVFCDRGMLDYVVMYELVTGASSLTLDKIVKKANYDVVFVCEELSHFNARGETGRSLSQNQSLQLKKLLIRKYAAATSRVYLLENQPVEQRVEQVIKKINSIV